MRFLHEDPFARLRKLREAIPNICFQMLLRASNAVGYAAYPDNVVAEFIYEAAAQGIDIFRIFDSLNWLPNMKASMQAVRKTRSVCEAAICYTGDILDPKRDKYSLDYYVKLAKQLEKIGVHFLGIKDMAGLCKPFAARKLVKTLREEIGLPIHFHTHDTAGVQAASILKASEAGVHIADAAISSMSGLTSQANLNSLVEALRNTERDTHLDIDSLNRCSDYWESVPVNALASDRFLLRANSTRLFELGGLLFGQFRTFACHAIGEASDTGNVAKPAQPVADPQLGPSSRANAALPDAFHAGWN
jgi:pyruvate carboxylase